MSDSPLVLGIDGGGSRIRVIVCSSPDDIKHQIQVDQPANPNANGYDAAATVIQNTVTQSLNAAGLSAPQISAAGIGVAGAEASREAEWLHQTLQPILPQAKIAIADGDHETALVGAHGARQGILLLSGTGSIAYGINTNGDTSRIGGWGWLLGDEGSGYWIGMKALQAVIRASEKRDPATSLTDALQASLDLNRDSLIKWAYTAPRTATIAGFAPLVLQHATEGDAVAKRIIERAAYELALKAQTVHYHLGMEDLPIAFAGSLLTHDNLLSQLVCARLKIETLPTAKYPPVVGAALLAFFALQTDTD